MMLPKSSHAVKPTTLDDAGLRIDLDLADVRAGREGEVGRVVERRLVEARLELVERVVVRHVRRQRDLAERLAAVGARDRELAVLELDVGVRGLEQVRGDLLALGDDLVERLDDRRAADRERARAVGAHAERNAAGVAVHDVDVVDRDAEPRRDDLRERRLVALAVAVRAGEDRDAAGRVHAHLARLEQPGARAERAGDVRRREPAGLDVRRVADARAACRASRLRPCAPAKPATSAIFIASSSVAS